MLVPISLLELSSRVAFSYNLQYKLLRHKDIEIIPVANYNTCISISLTHISRGNPFSQVCCCVPLWLVLNDCCIWFSVMLSSIKCFPAQMSNILYEHFSQMFDISQYHVFILYQKKSLSSILNCTFSALCYAGNQMLGYPPV